MSHPDNIALFDMDGTLCDYDKGLFRELEKLRAPGEPVFNPPLRGNVPRHIMNRANLIRSREEWWARLPKFQLGWDVLEVARKLDYRVMVLTQGPRKNYASWSGKKRWINRHLGSNTDVTMTRDKSLVYGRVLVDDYPSYVGGWLDHRRHGLVIMPAHPSNENYRHPQVIRYDGHNLRQVEEAMRRAMSK